ncbi:MAG TPA: energy transducer TonB [Gemmatimonadaceae bacterium]|nr:energy transducer TonB [Gemmatimonadaceae bacterium]
MTETTRDAHDGRRPGRILARAALGAGLALIAIVAACETPTPTHVLTPDASASVRRASEPTPMGADQQYFEFQVEEPVSYVTGVAPQYPAELRAAGVNGSVMAQFVVDTMGRVEVGTFKAIESSHDLFTESVRRTLPELRFTPAKVGGRRVRQLVQQPFMFNLGAKALTKPGATPEQVREAPSMPAGARMPLKLPAKTVAPTPTPAVFLSGEPAEYPAELRAAGVEGQVIADFVVGTDGVPVSSTLRIVSSPDPRFDAAVAAALPTYRFTPARVGDRAVRQLVRQPFVFALDR